MKVHHTRRAWTPGGDWQPGCLGSREVCQVHNPGLEALNCRQGVVGESSRVSWCSARIVGIGRLGPQAALRVGASLISFWGV